MVTRGDLIVDPEFSLAHEASYLLTLASKYDCCFHHGLMRHVIEDDRISNREFAGKCEIAADIAC